MVPITPLRLVPKQRYRHLVGLLHFHIFLFYSSLVPQIAQITQIVELCGWGLPWHLTYAVASQVSADGGAWVAHQQGEQG